MNQVFMPSTFAGSVLP